MSKKFSTFIFLIGMLSACSPAAPQEPTLSASDIHTAAAKTVIAEFTQTAQAVPPTPEATATKVATNTPENTAMPVDTVAPTTDPLVSTATPITCDDAIFIDDITVPDGTEMLPGQDFVKTWKVKNTGSCIWSTGYAVEFAYGEKMGGIAEPITAAAGPNEEIEISVRFKAPNETGQYTSVWRMANASASPFGQNFFVQIVVR